jgi:hypothetical protein
VQRHRRQLRQADETRRNALVDEHRRDHDDGRGHDVRQLAELSMPGAPLRADQLRLHDEHAQPERQYDAVRVKPDVGLLEQTSEVARPECPHGQRQKHDEEARAEPVETWHHTGIH